MARSLFSLNPLEFVVVVVEGGMEGKGDWNAAAHWLLLVVVVVVVVAAAAGPHSPNAQPTVQLS